MKKKDFVLNLEIRRVIYNFLLKHPGVYMREISRIIKIPKSTLNYHLRYMSKNELITSKKDGEYLRYYADKNIGRFEKKVLNIIRKKTYLHIILYLSMYHKSKRNEIAKDLDKSPSTIYSCLKTLIELDIVEEFKVKKTKLYRLKFEKETDNIMIKYKHSLLDKWVIFFFNYLDYIYSDKHFFRFLVGLKYKLKDDENLEDYIIKLIEDVFPNPYHV